MRKYGIGIITGIILGVSGMMFLGVFRCTIVTVYKWFNGRPENL